MNVQKRFLGLLVILLLGIGVQSCKSTEMSEKEQVFRGLFPSVKITDQIVLQQIDFGSSANPRFIDFVLKNETGDYLHISAIHDIKMFIYEGSQWVPIDDSAQQIGKTESIIPPKSKTSGENTYLVSLSPSYAGSSMIRIMVICSIYRDGKVTDEKIGTYIDIQR